MCYKNHPFLPFFRNRFVTFLSLLLILITPSVLGYSFEDFIRLENKTLGWCPNYTTSSVYPCKFGYDKTTSGLLLPSGDTFRDAIVDDPRFACIRFNLTNPTSDVICFKNTCNPQWQLVTTDD